MTHDLSSGGWGRDYTFEPVAGTNGHQGIVTGWCSPRIKDSDFLILRNKGNTTQYQVDFVEYERDPADMFHALVWFVPRTTNAEAF